MPFQRLPAAAQPFGVGKEGFEGRFYTARPIAFLSKFHFFDNGLWLHGLSPPKSGTPPMFHFCPAFQAGGHVFRSSSGVVSPSSGSFSRGSAARR